jgi:outer membrane immunogenic protein
MKKYLPVGAALACLSSAAMAQDDSAPAETRLADAFAGPRLEARIGWETPTVSGDGDVYKIGSAVSFGGEVGYDFAAGSKVTVGPYVTYEFSSVELCDGGDCLSVERNLGAGARIGLALSPRAALYGKVGYADISIKATTGNVSASDSKGGIQGAIGAEFSLGKMVYASVEANYGDYGKFYGINLQRRHVAAGLGIRF